MASGRASAWGIRMTLTYFVAPASFLAETWDALGLGLDKGGHRLRASKCAAWAPSCAGRAPDRMPDGIKALAEHITINDSGFKLLGGDLEFDIDVGAVGLAPARKRAARATQLAARIEQFVTASPTPQAAHHAWFLILGFQMLRTRSVVRLPLGPIRGLCCGGGACVGSCSVDGERRALRHPGLGRHPPHAARWELRRVRLAQRDGGQLLRRRVLLGLGHECAQGAHDCGGAWPISSWRSSRCGGGGRGTSTAGGGWGLGLPGWRRHSGPGARG